MNAFNVQSLGCSWHCTQLPEDRLLLLFARMLRSYSCLIAACEQGLLPSSSLQVHGAPAPAISQLVRNEVQWRRCSGRRSPGLCLEGTVGRVSPAWLPSLLAPRGTTGGKTSRPGSWRDSAGLTMPPLHAASPRAPEGTSEHSQEWSTPGVWSDSAEGRVFALHVAGLDLIPGTT